MRKSDLHWFQLIIQGSIIRNDDCVLGWSRSRRTRNEGSFLEHTIHPITVCSVLCPGWSFESFHRDEFSYIHHRDTACVCVSATSSSFAPFGSCFDLKRNVNLKFMPLLKRRWRWCCCWWHDDGDGARPLMTVRLTALWTATSSTMAMNQRICQYFPSRFGLCLFDERCCEASWAATFLLTCDESSSSSSSRLLFSSSVCRPVVFAYYFSCCLEVEKPVPGSTDSPAADVHYHFETWPCPFPNTLPDTGRSPRKLIR